MCAYQPPQPTSGRTLRGLEAFWGELQVTLVLLLRTTPPATWQQICHILHFQEASAKRRAECLFITWDGSISMFEFKFMAKFVFLITHVNIKSVLHFRERRSIIMLGRIRKQHIKQKDPTI